MADLPYPSRFTFAAPPDFVRREWADRAERAYRAMFENTSRNEQCVYRVYAGTGAGKTSFAAAVAMWTLNQREPRHTTRIVYVCPNRLIAKAVVSRFHDFGIYLAEWNNKKHATEGEGRFRQGCVMTYQSLAKCAGCQRLFTQDTLVVFDEFHHLADELAWGAAAVEAFEGRPECTILMMSGTPFRSDNNPVPFGKWLPLAPGSSLYRLECDFVQTLGQCIVDGLCRKPIFPWSNVEVQTPSGPRRLSPAMPCADANELLRLAVHHSSPVRLAMLAQSRRLVDEEDRPLIVFLGGDSFSDQTATYDANHIIPGQLVHVGFKRDDICVVTSTNRNALERIAAFSGGQGRVLVTINMVSEGVDIQRLSAGCFLTSITAENTMAQRVGRCLRGQGFAPIVAARHPAIEQFALEIDREVQHAVDMSEKRRLEREPGSNGRRVREAPVLRHVFDGHTFNSSTYSQAQREQAVGHLAQRGLRVDEANVSLVLEILFGGKRSGVA